jgi:hypothetical protein
MNWEEVGAIGQVLGSVAVFITLGYLAVQVRHARMETRRSTSYVGVSSSSQQQMAFAVDERWARIWTKANVGLGTPIPPFMTEIVRLTGVTTEEAASLLSGLHAQWEAHAHTIEYMDELSSEERAQVDGMLRGMFMSRLYRTYYDHHRSTLNRHAVRYIDGLMAQPSTAH